MKTKLFSILGSAIFEIYADTTHEDYSKHILTNTNIFCMACPLILFSTFPTTILLLYKHTIGNTGTIVFERMILSNAVTQKKKKKKEHVMFFIIWEVCTCRIKNKTFFSENFRPLVTKIYSQYFIQKHV